MNQSKIIPVRVYFPDDDEGRRIVRRLKAVSKKSGLSVSRVAGKAIEVGLFKVEEAYTDVVEKLEASSSK